MFYGSVSGAAADDPPAGSRKRDSPVLLTPPHGRGRLPRRRRRGSVLPVVTVLMVMLVGMVSFAVDVGYIARSRTQMQATADAGTLAGLAKLYAVSGATQDFTSARAEVNKYVGG